eukprot:sb/3474528/
MDGWRDRRWDQCLTWFSSSKSIPSRFGTRGVLHFLKSARITQGLRKVYARITQGLRKWAVWRRRPHLNAQFENQMGYGAAIQQIGRSGNGRGLSYGENAQNGAPFLDIKNLGFSQQKAKLKRPNCAAQMLGAQNAS